MIKIIGVILRFMQYTKLNTNYKVTYETNPLFH